MLAYTFYTKVLRQTWMSQIPRVHSYTIPASWGWEKLKNHLRQFKTDKMKSKLGITYTHSHTHTHTHKAGKVYVCSIWVMQPMPNFFIIKTLSPLNSF